jgi:3-oxoacyl-[acyl-carrier protein] reductase
MELFGSVAAVTGGASGIGAAVSRAFARAGAKVAILDRDAALAGALAEEIGPQAMMVNVDVSDPHAVEAAMEQVVGRLGRLDSLVSSAGVRSAHTIAGMSYDEWQRVIDINLSPSFYCIKSAAPHMRKSGGGAIVLISSTAGKHVSLHGGANYTTAKAGMLGLARQAAFELAPDRIRVNVVCPGPTRTAMSAKSTWPAERMIPLGSWIMPEDVAESVLFLCSAAARMCTGTSLDVDGGFLLASGVSYDDYFAKRDKA